mgnify:CR=1 FL=1
MRHLILILTLALAPVALLAVEEDAPAASARAGEATEENKDPAIGHMESLAKAGIEKALEVVQQSRGFYPFALVLNDQGQVRLIGYQGEPGQRPGTDDFAAGLFLQLRNEAQSDSSLIAASVFKPMRVKADDGSDIPGVWSAVDHRQAPSFVMFQPLIQKEPGRYVMGDIIYQKSTEPIFIDPAANGD